MPRRWGEMGGEQDRTGIDVQTDDMATLFLLDGSADDACARADLQDVPSGLDAQLGEEAGAQFQGPSRLLQVAGMPCGFRSRG